MPQDERVGVEPDAPAGPVGRDAEVAWLRAAVLRAASGQGDAVLVQGDPGTGKTALLDVLAAYCRRARMTVLRCAGSPLEQGLPFAALLSGLRGAQELARACPQLAVFLRGEGMSDAPSHTDKIAATFAEALHRATGSGPVALLLDDVQWADSATVRVLSRLARLPRKPPILVAAASRPAPHLRLPETIGIPDHRHLNLGPLDALSAAALTSRAAGARASQDLIDLVAPAAGNPRHITTMVTELARHDGLRITDGCAEPTWDGRRRQGSAAAPWSEMVLRELDTLSDAERDVVEVVSILGPRVRLDDLSLVLGTSVMRLRQTASGTAAAAVLDDDGVCLSFRHDLVRRTLADSLPAAVRTAIRLQAAEHSPAEVDGALEPAAWVLRPVDAPAQATPVQEAHLHPSTRHKARAGAW